MPTFFSTTFNIVFLAQYLAGKAIDTTAKGIKDIFFSSDTTDNLIDLLSASLETLFTSNDWEFDYTSVHNILSNNISSVYDINQTVLKKCLKELLGSTYPGDSLLAEWDTTIVALETDIKYQDIFNLKIQKELIELKEQMKLLKLETNISSLPSSPTPTISEDIIDDALIEASELLDSEDYNNAVKEFTIIATWTTNKEIKKQCKTSVAFCTYKLRDFHRAIKLYKQALRFPMETDEKAWIYHNIALIHIECADISDKLEHYKEANEIFQNIIDLNPSDRYIIDSRIHISRNKMDECDLCDLDQAKKNLLDATNEFILIINENHIMNYEQGFIVLQSLGRCYVQLAEKYYLTCFLDLAEAIFQHLFEEKEIKKNNVYLGIICDNLAELYFFKFSNISEEYDNILLSNARYFYKLAGDYYKETDEYEKLFGVKLDLASLEYSQFLKDMDYSHLDLSAKHLSALESEYSTTNNNSFLIRIYIKMMEILYQKALLSDTPSDILQAYEDYINKAEIAGRLHSFAKYNTAVQILKLDEKYLRLTLLHEDIDINSCINELNCILRNTASRNTNLYEFAEGTLNNFLEYENNI